MEFEFDYLLGEVIMQDQYTAQFIGDITSEWAKDVNKHEELSNDIRQKLEKQIPSMIERIAETRPYLIPEYLEYSNLLVEAKSAYSFGFWRAVIALIGVAGESFTDRLYQTVNHVTSIENIQMKRQELFGNDEYVRGNNKIAALLFCNIIEKPIYTKLCRIKKLRDSYVHPTKRVHDVHSEAKETLNTFIEIMDWYVNKTVGKIRPGMSIRMEKIE